MPAVGAGDAVALLEHAREPDSHRLLSRVQMRRAVHLAAQEEALHAVLEPPDEQHPAIEVRREAGFDCSGRGLGRHRS